MTVRLLALLVLAAPLAAQPAAPLADALQALARSRSVRLVYDAGLVAGRTTTCPASTRSSGRSVSVVLACVLDGTGLEARRLPSGSYALYRTRAPDRPAPRPQPPPAARPAAPEPDRTLSGVVRDRATGETLIGAAVYAPALGRGATTNAYGFYSLSLPAGSVRVVTSYVGQVANDTTLALAGHRRRDVALAADTTAAFEVVVEDTDDPAPGAYATVALSGDDVQSLPALLGEADLLRALQTQPGVGGGVEGTAGLHVRGGSPDQTLVLLDGIPVYNASHLFGFLSTFNAEAVRRVELFKGGFPARYGGRLSSVVDVRMREGNTQERQRHARIGLLSGQAIVEGPLAGADGSYMVAGRRTYLDLLALPVLAATDGIDGLSPTAYFYDLNAKANARVSGKDRLYLSLYAGRDRFAASTQDGDSAAEDVSGFLTWGNATGALRWTRPLSGRLFAATTLTVSDYQFDVGTEAVRLDPVAGPSEVVGARYVSGIRDVALQTDLDWAPGGRHAVRVGGMVSRHRYAPGLFEYRAASTAETLGAQPVGSWEGAVYAEDEVHVGPAQVSVGVRASGYAVEGRAFGAVEPRLAARVGVGRGVEVRGSLARMAQYLHLLTTVGGIGLPADLWVPATARVPPEGSWQAAAGVAGTAGRTRWSIDGYVKAMDGLVSYRESSDFVRADATWEDQVVTGSGRAAGVELAMAHEGPRTAARLAYTLARATRQSDDLDDGARYPYRYDRRHDLGLSVRHRLSRRVDVSAGFVYQSGLPFTPAGVTYFAPQPGVDLTTDSPDGTGSSQQVYGFGDRNGARLPAVHRLDVGLDLYFRRGPRPHALSFEVYNLYNRSNPFYVDRQSRVDPATGETETVLVGKGVLPVLPSVSYEFSF